MIALLAGQPEAPRPRWIGAQRQPRVLLVGDLPDDVVAVVTELAPTVGRVAVSDLAALRQAEWDVAVTAGSLTEQQLDGALHALVLAEVGLNAEFAFDGSSPAWTVSAAAHAQRCNEFEPVGEDVPAEFRALVTETLIPFFRGPRTPYWTFVVAGSRLLQVLALARDAVHRPLSVIYVRPRSINPLEALRRLAHLHIRPLEPLGPVAQDGGVAVVVPCDVTQRARWVRQTLRYLARIDPQRCGGLRGWDDDPRWQPPPLRATTQELADHRTHRERIVAELDAETERLVARADLARVEAREHEGRLLTEQSDALVDAVVDALTHLGFDVRRSDLAARKGDLLEDLEVRDPDDPQWVCLGEIRGYKGGAAVGDLARIDRFCDRYADAHGEPPTRRWYVVNQFLDDHPDTRPEPLASNPTERSLFAARGGLVIDTRALFDLHHRTGHAAIRATLRQLTGVVTTGDDVPGPR